MILKVGGEWIQAELEQVPDVPIKVVRSTVGAFQHPRQSGLGEPGAVGLVRGAEQP
jgi:hypothetical protein